MSNLSSEAPSGRDAAAQATVMTRGANVAADATYAMFAKALYLATRLCVPPLVLAHVSLVEYGLWSACFVLIMYIGLSDAGFSNVYVRYCARYHAAGDVQRINRLMSTGIITLSCIALLLFSGLWSALPMVMDLLKVDVAQRGTATVLVLGSAGMFLLDLTLGAYCYLLHGIQRIRDEQRIAVSGYLLELAFIVVFLHAGFGVYSLLAAFVARYSYSLANFVRLAHRLVPGLRVSVRLFDRECLKLFFGFGLAVQASTLFSTFLFSLDRLLAGLLLGPKGIALFELGGKLPVSAISVPSAIINVTLPVASRLSAGGDDAGIRKLYLQTTRSISMLSGVPLGFMAAFSVPLCGAWLGNMDELHDLPLIMAVAAVACHLHVTTGPGSAIFRAKGKVANEFVYHGLRVAALAAAIGAACLLLGTSAVSLVIGLGTGSACAALGYLAYNQRQLGLRLRDLLQKILIPGFVTYPVGYALHATFAAWAQPAVSRWQSLALLSALGLLHCLALLGVAWRWILDEPERYRVRDLVSRALGAIPRWRKT